MELRASYQIPAKTEPLPAGSTQLVKKVFDKQADGSASSPTAASTSFAEIFRISGRKNRKEAFFCSGNGIFRRFQSSRVRRTRRRARLEAQESFGHIELSEGFFDIAIACRQCFE